MITAEVALNPEDEDPVTLIRVYEDTDNRTGGIFYVECVINARGSDHRVWRKEVYTFRSGGRDRESIIEARNECRATFGAQEVKDMNDVHCLIRAARIRLAEGDDESYHRFLDSAEAIAV